MSRLQKLIADREKEEREQSESRSHEVTESRSPDNNRMAFLDMPEEIISAIFDNLHVIVLQRVLMTNKRLFLQRNYYIENNAITKAYYEYDKNVSFINAYLNSDIIYSELNNTLYVNNDITSESSNIRINNTCNLLIFNASYNIVMPYEVFDKKGYICNYFSNQIEKKYPEYSMTTKKAQNVVEVIKSFFNTYALNTKIDLYDIYQCIFHVKYRKFKCLKEVFVSMKIRPPATSCEFNMIIKSFLNYLTSNPIMLDNRNKILKAVIISMLFQFIFKTPVELIGEKMKQVLFMQASALMQQIDNIKNIPKYIKLMLKNPLANVAIKLTL